jgi:hypothetical protein
MNNHDFLPDDVKGLTAYRFHTIGRQTKGNGGKLTHHSQ